MREIDYYIKGLSIGARQEIFKKLDRIGLTTVKSLLEKNQGYTRYKNMWVF